MKRNHLFLDLEARESRSEDEDEGEESGLDGTSAQLHLLRIID